MEKREESGNIYRIPVIDDSGTIVARVKYNENLDFWDGGHNWSCGEIGRHKGITKLKNGKFVLIFGTRWEKERDSARVVSDEEALQAILKARNDELLTKYFPGKARELEEEEEE